jgi:7,8-dihydro-6-hydroxymethylpterin-pyrophosphokinase
MAKDTKYVSDITQFIKSYLHEHPKVVDKQKQLRSTWWDTKGIDQAEQNSYQNSAVKLDGYSYFSYPSNKS